MAQMMESLRSGAAAAAAATILATGGYVVYKDRMRYPRMIRRYSSGNIVAPLAENQYEVAYYKRKLLQKEMQMASRFHPIILRLKLQDNVASTK